MPRYDDDGNLIADKPRAAGSASLRFDDDGNPLPATAAKPGATSMRAATPEDRNLKQWITEKIPESGMSMLKGFGDMLMNPLDTARSIGSVAQGGLEKVERKTGVPGKLALATLAGPFAPAGIAAGELLDAQVGKGKEPVFDAAAQAMKERYGGVENIKTTLYEDPVGSAADISSVLVGAGGATSALGLPRTAKYLEMVGRAIDPITGMRKVVGGTTGLISKGTAAASEAYLGKSTGVGRDAIQIAKKGSPEFQKYMHGNEPAHEQILGTVRGAVRELQDRRRVKYQSQLAALPQNVTLDIKPVYATMNDTLKKFGVKVTVDPEKGFVLDFGRSDLKRLPREQAKVEALFADLMEWGKQPGDFSPLGIDRLKKGIGNVLTDGEPGPGDAFVNRVKDKVTEALTQQVPGYAEMTRDYATASDFLRDITSELSVKAGAAKGAGIRKLTTALNQRSEYRKNLIEAIDNELGTDLQGAIAGAEMNALLPRGLMGPASVSMIPASVIAAMSGIASNPVVTLGALLGTGSFSPRIVGEIMLGIAKARRSRLAQMYGAVAPIAKDIVFDAGTYRFVQSAEEGERRVAEQAEQDKRAAAQPPMPPPPPSVSTP